MNNIKIVRDIVCCHCGSVAVSNVKTDFFPTFYKGWGVLCVNYDCAVNKPKLYLRKTVVIDNRVWYDPRTWGHIKKEVIHNSISQLE